MNERMNELLMNQLNSTSHNRPKFKFVLTCINSAYVHMNH